LGGRSRSADLLQCPCNERRQRQDLLPSGGRVAVADREKAAQVPFAHMDGATLYFECLWMDVDSNAVGAHSFSDMKLVRVHGHWLVKGIRVGKIEAL
jgi:hypothetical protein